MTCGLRKVLQFNWEKHFMFTSHVVWYRVMWILICVHSTVLFNSLFCSIHFSITANLTVVVAVIKMKVNVFINAMWYRRNKTLQGNCYWKIIHFMVVTVTRLCIRPHRIAPHHHERFSHNNIMNLDLGWSSENCGKYNAEVFTTTLQTIKQETLNEKQCNKQQNIMHDTWI